MTFSPSIIRDHLLDYFSYDSYDKSSLSRSIQYHKLYLLNHLIFLNFLYMTIILRFHIILIILIIHEIYSLDQLQLTSLNHCLTCYIKKILIFIPKIIIRFSYLMSNYVNFIYIKVKFHFNSFFYQEDLLSYLR